VLEHHRLFVVSSRRATFAVAEGDTSFAAPPLLRRPGVYLRMSGRLKLLGWFIGMAASRRSPRFLLFLAGLLILPSGTIHPKAQQRQAATAAFPRTADRLRIAEFYLDGEIDRFYNVEEPRLEALCHGQPDIQKCRVANLRPFDKVLAVVRDAPSERGKALGELHAVLGFHPAYGLGYRIDFVPKDSAGPRRVWLDSVGDWGYGIEIPGARARGAWIQLFDDALPRQSWIPAGSPSFHGEVSGIVGALVSLPPLTARYPDGSRRSSPEGSYLIERVQNGVVTIRREIETDFACGEDAMPPAVMPPSLQVPVAGMFTAKGEPVFFLTYSRGC
jgi:hypothetical protein